MPSIVEFGLINFSSSSPNGWLVIIKSPFLRHSSREDFFNPLYSKIISLTLIPIPIFSSKNTSAPRFNKVLIVSIWIGDLESVSTEDFKAEIIKICV